MKKKDWKLSVMQHPSSFHLCITHIHDDTVCDSFITDLQDSINYVNQNPNKKIEGTLALYGTNANIERSLFLKEIVDNFIHLLSKNKVSNNYKN